MTQQVAVATADKPKPRATPWPHDYEVSLQWEGGDAGLLSAGSRPAIVTGPPPQFGGEPEWWSPEHLLLSAVSSCLMTTFRAFAAKQALDVQRYSSVVKGMLAKTPTGIMFTSIVISVDLTAAPDRLVDAVRLLEDAKHYCIVANALKTPVDLRISPRAA
jgi:organic hydroperoxide reductase OsmC/OhrA